MIRGLDQGWKSRSTFVGRIKSRSTNSEVWNLECLCFQHFFQIELPNISTSCLPYHIMLLDDSLTVIFFIFPLCSSRCTSVRERVLQLHHWFPDEPTQDHHRWQSNYNQTQNTENPRERRKLGPLEIWQISRLILVLQCHLDLQRA